jgi:transposase
MKRIQSDLLGDACLAVVDELRTQPELFDFNAIPVDFGALRGAKEIARTGKITARDDARALAVACCKLAGLSDRETERRTGVSATTVPGVMRALEAAGRIPSAHNRLTQNLSELAESSCSEMQRIIRHADGEWTTGSSNALKSLSIALGIVVDKSQLLTGQATAIIDQRVSGPSVEAAAEWERKLRQAFGTVIDVPDTADVTLTNPPDVQSGDFVSNSLIVNDSDTEDTPLDTSNPAKQGAGGVAPGDDGGERRRIPPNNL